MQPEEKTSKSAGTVMHPAAAEWMGFLYEEIGPSRKREMREHLRNCSECARQVQEWRNGMAALDSYRPAVPSVRRAPAWQPALRWAAAAAMILFLGFLLGRKTGDEPQLQELRAAVERLETASSKRATDSSQVVSAVTEAANQEMLRLLDDYTLLLGQQRAQDRQATALALRTLEAQYQNLRTELETLAVNTEDGLQLTHRNLARLTSHSQADESPTSGLDGN